MIGDALSVAPIFIVFCRVSGCIMIAPGLSSDRVPVRARLYIAIAITLALGPALVDDLSASFVHAGPSSLAVAIMSESLIGVFLGLLARLYFFALETMLTGVAMTIGLGNIFNSAILDAESAPQLSSFLVLCAVMMIFVTDQHLQIIRGLYLSYDAAPITQAPDAEALLRELANILMQSHLLALRICSPFFLFGFLVNLAFGFLARLTPQVPVYFVSSPFVIVLGLYLMAIMSKDFLVAFTTHFGSWLTRG